MSIWIHTAILATTLAAAIAIGLTSAASRTDMSAASIKTDRLAVAVASEAYTTIETRSDGVSILERVPTN